MNQLNENEKQNALNEVRILASINNPNVICFKESFIDGNSLCIIMDLCDGGDLQFKIKQRKMMNERIPEKTIWDVLIKIVLGLKNLHDK